MKTKKITVILLAVAIFAVVVFSFLFIFSAREVEVDFNISDNFDSVEIQQKLDKYKGKNLLFFNTEEIAEEFTDNPFIEVVSVEKNFPNVLRVSIKERVKAFSMQSGDKVLILSTDGVVLEEIDKTAFNYSRDLIDIDLGSDIKIFSSKIGSKVLTSNDIILSTIINMITAVNSNDCIRTVKLAEQFKSFTATFGLYSGVDLIVTKIEDSGVDKIITGFKAYNGEIADENGKYITDFEKFTSSIYVVKLEDGTICPTWLGGE